MGFKTTLLSIGTFLLCLLLSTLYAEPVNSYLRIGDQYYFITSSLQFELDDDISQLMIEQRKIEFIREDLLTQLNFVETIFEEQSIPSLFYALALKESNYLRLNEQERTLKLWKKLPATMIKALRLQDSDEIRSIAHLGKVSEETALFLKSNHAKINNWLFTVLMMRKSVKYAQAHLLEITDRHPESQYIVLDNNIDPYLRQFLVYYLFVEKEKQKSQQKYELVQYKLTQRSSLKRLARFYGCSVEEIKHYNPWLKSSRVPQDKHYPIIIKQKLTKPISWKQIEHPILPPAPAPIEQRSEAPSQDVLPIQPPREEKLPKSVSVVPKDISGGDPPEPPASNKVQPASIPEPKEEPAPSTPILPNYHTVAQKETLYSISRRYNLNIHKLRQLNGLGNQSTIYAGQRLKLRDNVSAVQPQPTNNTYHVVKPGETLYRISQRYGIDLQIIKQANQLESINRIKAGQKLLIPKESPLMRGSTSSEKNKHIEIPQNNHKSTPNKHILRQKNYHKSIPTKALPKPKSD